jgi:hypothetical protein
MPSNLFPIRPDGTGRTQLTTRSPDNDLIWMPAYRQRPMLSMP